MEDSRVCWYSELIKQGPSKAMKIGWWWECGVAVHEMWHSSQVVMLLKLGTFLGDHFEVVAAMAQVE